MTRPANVEAFINKALVDARRVRRVYGVPVSVFLAQGGWESLWGTTEGAKNGVWFGQTTPSSGPDTWTSPLEPKVHFKKYPTFAEAATAYGENLMVTGIYPISALKAYKDDPDKFLDTIGFTYSVNADYASKLKAMIRDFKLKEFDAPDAYYDQFIFSVPKK